MRTEPPFAYAAIAHAEIFRMCGKVLAAMRHVPLERSLKATLRGDFNRLFAASCSDDKQTVHCVRGD